MIAGNLNAALKSPVARRLGLRVVAISVDPRRDTRAAVRRYVRERGLLPSFRYLTGSRAQLERVWKGFHIAVLDGPKGTVTHSAVQFLIDPRGRELLTYGSDVKAAEVIHDLELLERHSAAVSQPGAEMSPSCRCEAGAPGVLEASSGWWRPALGCRRARRRPRRRAGGVEAGPATFGDDSHRRPEREARPRSRCRGGGLPPTQRWGGRDDRE